MVLHFHGKQDTAERKVARTRLAHLKYTQIAREHVDRNTASCFVNPVALLKLYLIVICIEFFLNNM